MPDYNTPPALATGDKVTTGFQNVYWRDNHQALYDRKPHLHETLVTRIAEANPERNNAGKVEWDLGPHNPDDAWVVAQPTRITATRSGIYWFHLALLLNGSPRDPQTGQPAMQATVTLTRGRPSDNIATVIQDSPAVGRFGSLVYCQMIATDMAVAGDFYEISWQDVSGFATEGNAMEWWPTQGITIVGTPRPFRTRMSVRYLGD